MTTTTQTLARRVDECIQNLDLEPLTDLYHPDVIFDVHVPNWRFQLQGPAALIGWYREQVDHMPGARTVWTRATPTDNGAVVEWEIRVGEGDQEHLCREVDIFHTDGERIIEHTIWCTGMWDPATIARQKSEAPMVRW